MSRHTYEYDEVVIGSSLAALFYCYRNVCPLLFKETNPPLTFDYFDIDFPFENIYFANNLRELKTPQGNITVGRKKLEVYNELLFTLSASGLIPFSDKIEKVRVDGERLRVSLKRGRTCLIKFKKLKVFPSDFLEGLSTTRTKKRKLKVVDVLKIIAKKHDYDLIKTKDNFIKEIHFVDSERRKDVKHIIVVSYLKQEEVESFDFSIVPLKYKLKYILEESGITKRESLNKLELHFIERKIYNENITCNAEREICQKQHNTAHLSLLDVYPWRLRHLLLDSSGMIR
tara:strand:- start:826 stop:1683 length:858 start_codon:yes stop_codon:yes gene_type:complete